MAEIKWPRRRAGGASGVREVQSALAARTRSGGAAGFVWCCVGSEQVPWSGSATIVGQSPQPRPLRASPAQSCSSRDSGSVERCDQAIGVAQGVSANPHVLETKLST